MTDAPWGPDHPAWVPGLDDDSLEDAIARAYSVPGGVTNARDMTGGDAHDAVHAGFRRYMRQHQADIREERDRTLESILKGLRSGTTYTQTAESAWGRPPPRRHPNAMTREDAMDVERARREGRIVDG